MRTRAWEEVVLTSVTIGMNRIIVRELVVARGPRLQLRSGIATPYHWTTVKDHTLIFSHTVTFCAILSLMAFLIGIDEAGYGPNLGPLVVAASG